MNNLLYISFCTYMGVPVGKILSSEISEAKSKGICNFDKSHYISFLQGYSGYFNFTTPSAMYQSAYFPTVSPIQHAFWGVFSPKLVSVKCDCSVNSHFSYYE